MICEKLVMLVLHENDYKRCLSDKHFHTDLILGFAKKEVEDKLIERQFSENIPAKVLLVGMQVITLR